MLKYLPKAPRPINNSSVDISSNNSSIKKDLVSRVRFLLFSVKALTCGYIVIYKKSEIIIEKIYFDLNFKFTLKENNIVSNVINI